MGERIMSKTARGRKADIMFLNIVFCLIVIFIHISSEVVTEMPKDTAFFTGVFSAQKLSSFVVQGFLLLSGVKLFLHKGDGIDFARYYVSRFFRVILPYVFWAVLYYLYFCRTGAYKFGASDLVWRLICGDIWAHFYFIIVLVQFEILAPLWMLLFKRGSAAVHIAFSAVITAICAQYLPSVLTTLFPSMPDFSVSNCFLRYQIYWTAGCLIGKNYEEFRKYLKSSKVIITITFIICAALYVFLALATLGHEPVWLELFNILYSMSAILFFYMISQLFTLGGGSALKPLAPFDRSTYTIYLVHCLMIVLLNNYLTAKGISDIPQRFAIRAAVIYTACFMLGYIWQFIKYLIKKAFAGPKDREIV